MKSGEKQKKKLSLYAQIMMVMGLGIAVGVFFGDYCGLFEPLGQS